MVSAHYAILLNMGLGQNAGNVSGTWVPNNSCFVFFVKLAEGMETPCWPRREKKAKRQKTRGRQQWCEMRKILIFFFLLVNTSVGFFFWFHDGSLCPDSDWDCGEEDSQDGEDMLCNTMVITGPTGVGKTAAVYACAQELGFKVQKLPGT